MLVFRAFLVFQFYHCHFEHKWTTIWQKPSKRSGFIWVWVLWKHVYDSTRPLSKPSKLLSQTRLIYLIYRLHYYIQSTPKSSLTIQEVEDTQFHPASPLHDVNHSHSIINHHLPPRQGLAYHRPWFFEDTQPESKHDFSNKKNARHRENHPPMTCFSWFFKRLWNLENTAFVNKKSHSIWGSTITWKNHPPLSIQFIQIFNDATRFSLKPIYHPLYKKVTFKKVTFKKLPSNFCIKTCCSFKGNYFF